MRKLYRVCIVVLLLNLIISCDKKSNHEKFENSKKEVLINSSKLVHGKTLTERKEIYQEIIKAQDTGDIYERKRDDSIHDLFYSKKINRLELKKEIKISSKLRKSIYKEEYKKLIKKHNITHKQKDSIAMEGKTNGWPFPSRY